MPKKKTTTSKENTRPADVTLDSHYGAIGICAVAAALRFKGETKNSPAGQGATQENDERFSEVAA